MDEGRQTFSDGARYFVINASVGRIRIFNAETGEVSDFPIAPECSVRAAAAGAALVGCRERTPYILRLSNREFYTAPGAHQATGVSWETIGRHWLRGSTAPSEKPTVVWLNWRTGKRVARDYFDQTDRDIDHPRLRKLQGGVFDRERTLSLYHTGDRALILARPGRDARLSSCSQAAAGYCSYQELSQSLVTWSEGNVVRAFDALSRTRYGWYLEGNDPKNPHEVAHTRDHVLVHARGAESSKLLWARVR